MSFWDRKLKQTFKDLSISTDSLSKVLLKNDDELIPHLLEHLDINVVERVLNVAGINIFDEKKYKEVILANGVYLVVKNNKGSNILAFSTNPLSSLEVFKINGVVPNIDSNIGFINPNNKLLVSKQKHEHTEINSKKIVKGLFQEAIDLGVSDIHIRPRSSTHMCFKFRVNGMIEDSKTSDLSNADFQDVASEINSLFGLNVTDYNDFKEKQSNTGKIGVFNAKQKPIDLRMQLNPLHTKFKEGSAKGKSIPNYIIRLMNTTSFRNLKDIGLSKLQVKEITGFCRHNNAGIFVAGPTGSGKTTLAYAILAEIHKQRANSVNVMSVEDPVEVDLPNTTQIEIGRNISFAQALKAIKRSDPDVVFCGEIRDKTTAHKVCEIKEVGNTVLTTIHADKSCDVIDRLKSTSSETSFGVPLDTIAKTLSTIIMPRLVRKVCEQCSVEVEAQKAKFFRKYSGYFDIRDMSIKEASRQGCECCSHTGYNGRIQVAEVLILDPSIKKMIIDNKPSEEIYETTTGKQEIKIDIHSQGVMLVKRGITTFSEITRVLPSKSDFGEDYENDHESSFIG